MGSSMGPILQEPLKRVEGERSHCCSPVISVLKSLRGSLVPLWGGRCLGTGNSTAFDCEVGEIHGNFTKLQQAIPCL